MRAVVVYSPTTDAHVHTCDAPRAATRTVLYAAVPQPDAPEIRQLSRGRDSAYSSTITTVHLTWTPLPHTLVKLVQTLVLIKKKSFSVIIIIF